MVSSCTHQEPWSPDEAWRGALCRHRSTAQATSRSSRTPWWLPPAAPCLEDRMAPANQRTGQLRTFQTCWGLMGSWLSRRCIFWGKVISCDLFIFWPWWPSLTVRRDRKVGQQRVARRESNSRPLHEDWTSVRPPASTVRLCSGPEPLIFASVVDLNHKICGHHLQIRWWA